jgi:hypothetical protein
MASAHDVTAASSRRWMYDSIAVITPDLRRGDGVVISGTVEA